MPATDPPPPAPEPPAAARPAADRYVLLGPGDPAPWFHQRSAANPRYAFDTAAGRYLVLCFFASAADPAGRAALAAVTAGRERFDDVRASFFGVSLDPEDEVRARIADSLPGLRYFFDFDGTIARLYGAIPHAARPDAADLAVRRFWLVLDPTMRVLARIPFAADGSDHAALFRLLDALPPPERFAGVELQAPVLYLPNVFEPEFCARLIEFYESQGGTESGFMREVDGKTRLITDPAFKRRRDVTIADEALIRETQLRISRRVAPEIAKVHQFQVTRMERYIVSCYAAEDAAHFRPHRDNTTRGTAHRRFAVSINLNAGFEGGEVSFPEYGARGFKAPPGAAVVFSCSLLHAVSRVTDGRRYAFLPFLYDDAAAKLREANNAHLGDGVGQYRS
ncbi:MAG: 2OG-Fe(II) oxygenase [Geminicoccaceae bacterium]